MANGMSFKSGRDMPPGMQEKMAMQIIGDLQKKNGVPSEDDVQLALARQHVACIEKSLTKNGWVRADQAKPLLAKKYLKDGSETIEYEESEPVLGYNGREMVVVYLVRDEALGERWYVHHDCEEINVTHWWPNKLPAPPEVRSDGM